ncbi:MAG TPA: CbtA family protein [Conexibacter sp.]|nr:CbtA family protein [Conexibacter sp.]
MERRFILRGFGAGAFAGLLAFAFARVMAEPVIQQSIDYESGRDAVQDALRKAAGAVAAPAGPDIFSRGIQADVGAGVGLILFGVALGGLFAVAWIVVQRRLGDRLRPRAVAALLAAACFLAVFLVPFLKYPANPPAIGHPETIHARGFLYLAMVVISVVSLAVATIGARRLSGRFGAWNGTLLAGLGFVAWIALMMAILPSLGSLHANVVAYGHFATETPQPLKDARGHLVYPGFPADTLFKFRLYSVIDQLILWGTLGLAFGPLVERVLARAAQRDGDDAGLARAPSANTV